MDNRWRCNMASAIPDDAKQQWMQHNQSATFHAAHSERVRTATENGEMRYGALVHGMYFGRKLPKTVLPELRSVGYIDAEQPQRWGVELHCNEGLELTFQEAGTMSFAIDDYEGTLQPNELVIARPWQWHRFGNPKIAAGCNVWLNLDRSRGA